MRACYEQCAHRRFVLDYVAERDAQLVRAEAAVDGNFRDLEDFFASVERKLLFKDYLRTHAGLDYPYPRPRPVDFVTATFGRFEEGVA